MAVLNGLHADAQQLSRQQIGASCNSASGNLGYFAFLTDALVAASNTNAALQAAVLTAAAAGHADTRFAAPRVNLGIGLGYASGELSDARLAALTTTTGLVQLTYATVSQNGAAPPE